MSEFQYVAFQAVDGPLNDKQLEFAQRQSSRAEVTRWSLEVEYHYSSFRGDVDGLLRRGYDVYLQFTNYGNREVKLRLPGGIPFAKNVWSQYVDGARLVWTKDATGRGGILSLDPFREADEIEFIGETQPYLDAVIHLRQRLLSGDLRALYLLWLCAANDDNNAPDEMIEPPVPHGIAELETDGGEFLSFFGLDPLLLVAAGSGVSPAPKSEAANHPVARWVEALDNQRAKDVLHRILVGDATSEKARLLAVIRDSQSPDRWPTSDKRRSLQELLDKTETLRAGADAKQKQKAQAKAKRDAAKAERERALRLKLMAKDPDQWLREAERFVDLRGTHNYKAAAVLLYDLREAVGGDEGSRITRRHAATLVKKHPTLTQLKGSLRKHGLLD